MRGTPIVIEPKHIRGTPSLNIVNNSWIDCVTIEERDVKLAQQSIFSLDISFYEETISTKQSEFVDITKKNSIQPNLTFSKTHYSGSPSVWCFYKINLKNTNRTLPTLPNLGCRHSRTKMIGSGEKMQVGTVDSYAHANRDMGSLRFYIYTSAQQFENDYVNNTGKLGEFTDCVAGFIYNGDSIDVLLVLRKNITSSGGTFYANYRHQIEIFLDVLVETPKTLRYRLNSAGQCVLAEDSFKPKYPYTHPSNELIQSGATSLNKYNNNAREPISKVIAHSLLYQWKRGKMSARMEVLNIQFHDINGNLAIDIKNPEMKQIFKPCDWVIPYIVEEQDGQMVKVPLAKKRNGEPMVFEIVGAEFRYDGEMTQYLKMVEVID